MGLSFLQDLGPVGLLLLGAAVCAALDLRTFQGRAPGPRATRWVALGALGLAFLASVGFWHSSFGAAPPDIEHGSLVIDRFALFLYATTLGAAAAILLCGSDAEDELDPHRGVFHALFLVGCAGVLVTASAADLASLGAGLALTGVPLGLAQGLRKTDAAAVRSAARALSVTGLALVLFMIGAAILAALGGSTSLAAIPNGLRHLDPLLVLAAVLVILGGMALVGGFPYLWWRARQATQLPSLPLIGGTVLSALAGTAMLLRVLAGALGAASSSWSLAVAVMAGLTLVLAPWLAWRQRRLGPAVVYLLLAQLALVPATLPLVSQRGTATILYLLLCTVPLAAGLLGLVGSIASQGVGSSSLDLRGLWARSPLLAGGLALLLAGIAGVPPLAGFFVRLMTVDAALQAGFGWLAWLELISAVLCALVAFRWLLTIFDARVDGPVLELPRTSAQVGVVLCVGAVLSFGILVGPLFAIATRASLAPLFGP